MKPEETASKTVELREALTAEEAAPIAPCEHMKDYVSALSDDTLRGPARWYTQVHTSYCSHCGPALRALRHLRGELGALRELPPEDPAAALTEERRHALQKAMEAADNAHAGGTADGAA